jgi:hypothetical protein
MPEVVGPEMLATTMSERIYTVEDMLAMPDD